MQASHVHPPSKPTAPLLQIVAARLRLLRHRQWCSCCCPSNGTATTHAALAGGGRGIGAAIALEFAKVHRHWAVRPNQCGSDAFSSLWDVDFAADTC